MISAIAGRELRSLFYSPLAWSLLAVVQLTLAWLFLIQLEDFLKFQAELVKMREAPGITDLVVAPLIDSAALLLLLITPLLSMRLISEELRNNTFGLLLSSPISMTQIVLGKYLALLAVFAVTWLLTSLMPLSLLSGGSIDLGRLAAGLLGLVLVSATFAAIGLFFSCLTRQPSVAAVSSYGLLLFLWIIDLPGSGDGESANLLDWLSLSTHFRRMTTGLVHSEDLIFYLLLTVAFLILSVKRLDRYR
ncbi:MAG: ABC transporter permease, partial [Chromatiales bacterium]|nr:ABC transporter permease [Chromatiales bacterium]